MISELALKRWAKAISNKRVRYRLYSWDEEKSGVWVHLKATPLAGGSDYSRCQVLSLKKIKRIKEKYDATP